MSARPIRIGLTMGDPAGIGPEIICKAAEHLHRTGEGEAVELVAIGAEACFEEAMQRLGHRGRVVTGGAGARWPDLAVEEAGVPQRPIVPGAVSAEAGRLAYLAVARAVELALAGAIDAIVTAPLSKEAMNLAGYPYAGHTELLAVLTQSRDSCLMLAHDNLVVAHVTAHVALAAVPKLITAERLGRVIELTDAALARMGRPRRRIAVAGLNPHAGEGGLFGKEEREVIEPTIAAYRARGYDLDGPIPGDTVFVKAAAGLYDAVLAMFHDQGHVPVKLLGFGIDRATGRWTSLRGVNVTLGLPVVRTSPDHGTAFDIAGQGIARPDSMLDAIAFARRLVGEGVPA